MLSQADYEVVRNAWKNFAKNSAGIGEAIPILMSEASILNHFFDHVLPELVEPQRE